MERTDQNGTVIAFNYNALRQLTEQEVTTDSSSAAAAGATNLVDKITRAYDHLHRLETITSYDGASTVNQIQYAYDDDYGVVSKVYQAHDGTVVTASTPFVQYHYDTSKVGDVISMHLRVNKVTYPGQWKIGAVAETFDLGYSTSGDQQYLNMTRYADDGFGTSSGYGYRTEFSRSTLGRMIIMRYKQGWDYIAHRYIGYSDWSYNPVCNRLDKFGRTMYVTYDDASWVDLVNNKYGYDRAGNRIWDMDNVSDGSGVHQDHYYTYDGLNRLTDAQRGQLNSDTAPTSICQLVL